MKAQGLTLLGYVMRMKSDRNPKMAFERKPVRTRKRWCEDVGRDGDNKLEEYYGSVQRRM